MILFSRSSSLGGLGRTHECAYGPALGARHQRPALDVWGVAGAAALPDAVLPGVQATQGEQERIHASLTAGCLGPFGRPIMTAFQSL